MSPFDTYQEEEMEKVNSIFSEFLSKSLALHFGFLGGIMEEPKRAIDLNNWVMFAKEQLSLNYELVSKSFLACTMPSQKKD